MIGTLSGYYAFTGGTADGGAVDQSLSAILVQSEAAIKKLCRPYQFEPVTLTDVILDAPWNTQDLHLPAAPVRSITSLYYRSDAQGDATLFTSADLLTAFTDYQLVIDDPVNGWSRSGKVRRLNRSLWGANRVRPYSRLGVGVVDEPGSIKVTFAAGCPSVPAEVTAALYLVTSMTYARRKTGMVTASASLNGASYSNAGPFTTTAALNSPDVRQLLSAYLTPVGVA